VVGLIAKDIHVPHRPSVPHGHAGELEWEGIRVCSSRRFPGARQGRRVGTFPPG
jgi:hypothetical protein